VLFGALLWLVGLLINEEEGQMIGEVEEEGKIDQETAQDTAQETTEVNP
jgi:hypothetical protein